MQHIKHICFAQHCKNRISILFCLTKIAKQNLRSPKATLGSLTLCQGQCPCLESHCVRITMKATCIMNHHEAIKCYKCNLKDSMNEKKLQLSAHWSAQTSSLDQALREHLRPSKGVQTFKILKASCSQAGQDILQKGFRRGCRS